MDNGIVKALYYFNASQLHYYLNIPTLQLKCNAWFEPLKHLVLTKLPAFVSLPYSSPGGLTEQKDPRKTNKRPGKSIYIRYQLIVNVFSTPVIECACCPSWEHTGSHELTPRINNRLLSSLKRVDLFCVRAGKHLFSAYTDAVTCTRLQNISICMHAGKKRRAC